MRTLLGCCRLAGLLLRSRLRLRGRYWTWRRETAMGDSDLGRGEKFRAVLEYARWLDRMRRISRSI